MPMFGIYQEFSEGIALKLSLFQEIIASDFI